MIMKETSEKILTIYIPLTLTYLLAHICNFHLVIIDEQICYITQERQLLNRLGFNFKNPFELVEIHIHTRAVDQRQQMKLPILFHALRPVAHHNGDLVDLSGHFKSGFSVVSPKTITNAFVFNATQTNFARKKEWSNYFIT